MTPAKLLTDLERMLDLRRFREMIDLTVRVLPDIRPQMTPDHAQRLHELMHVADIFGDVGERRDMTTRTDVDVRARRSS